MKQVAEHLPCYHKVRRWIARRRHRRAYAQWRRAGSPLPPPHLVKQATLLEYAAKYRTRVLVETGTFLGEMVEAMQRSFRRIYSIELSPTLFARAQRTLADFDNLELLCGDSTDELGALVKRLEEPALFWLDGHYSGGVTAMGSKATPILEELEQILSHTEERHVILIDDARCFGADPAYPTLEALAAFVSERREDIEVDTKDDIIRLTPQ